ncbi:hypothetical protein MMC08_006996 [Hypocenomyce scalaris]|nr:hypothetical protein [Hypocenomyce scalaris]
MPSPPSQGTRPKPDNINEADERSPLLPDDHKQPQDKLLKIWNRKTYTFGLVITLVILFNGGTIIQEAPKTRLFESIFCYHFYREHDPSFIGADGTVPEHFCKIEPVQSDVAMLKGWQVFLDNIPTILLAIPFGIFADKYGRKPLILLNSISLCLRTSWIIFVCHFWQTIPIRWVWLSAFHGLLGGSTAVITSMIFVMTSDIVPENQRSTTFFWVGGCALGTLSVGQPLSALLMERSPWVPIWLGLGLLLLAVIVACVLPETLHMREKALASGHHHVSADSLSLKDDDAHSVFQRTRLTARKFGKAASFLVEDMRVFILLCCFMIGMLTQESNNVLLQYVSKRYDWTLSKATLFISIRYGLNVFLLIVLLPLAGRVLQSWLHLSAAAKDLWLSRTGIILKLFGFLVLGAAPNIPTLGIGLVLLVSGGGTMLCMRSLITSLVEPHHIARLYNAISVLDTLGYMIGGPIMAACFRWGMKAGGGWIGLPFWFCGLLVALVGIAIWALRFPEVRRKAGDREEQSPVTPPAAEDPEGFMPESP